MYLCTCKSVSDLQIRQAVEQGARSFGDLSIRFGVGVECGKCIDGINTLLQECLSAPAALPSVPAEADSQPLAAPTAPAPTPQKTAPAHAWFAIDM